MPFLELADRTPWFNLALFAVAAGGVWLSGFKLSAYVDLIADRTGIGKAFAGAVLLGGATSLPEIATTITASVSGAAELAGNNLLGGVAMQIAVLAVIDAVLLRGKALTLFAPRAELLMQGVLLIFIVSLAAAAVASGEVFTFAGVGMWPVLMALTYLVGLWVLFRYEANPRWEPAGEVREPPESARDLKDVYQDRFLGVSTADLFSRFALAAVGVLISGFVVAKSGEVLAEQAGIAQSFVGATLVALATSLPEVSTTWSAVRFGAYSMAVANVLGTNSLEIALFLPAEVGFDGSIIDAMQPSAAFLAALGVMMTSVFLWGILERSDRTVLGVGRDSATVLVLYASGLGLFYFL